MADDDLIMLWSLAGMELWEQRQRLIDFDAYVKLLIRPNRHHLLLETYAIGIDRGEFRFGFKVKHSDIILHVIEDLLTFNPDERWWKLLFAKYWYERNKEQFHD